MIGQLELVYVEEKVVSSVVRVVTVEDVLLVLVEVYTEAVLA